MAMFSLPLPAKEMSKEDRTNYLFMLNEHLKYIFSHLDEDNLSDEMKEKFIRNDENYAKLVRESGKLSWIIGDSTSETEMVLTPEMIKIISDEVNITGAVTFDDLKTAGKCVINAGNITAGSVSGDRIKGGEISGTTIGAVNISSTSMSGMTITGETVSGLTIEGGQITGNSLEIPVSEGSSLYIVKADANSAMVGDFTFDSSMRSNGGKDFRVMKNGEMWAYLVYCSNPSATLSDGRLKEDVEEIDGKKALKFVCGLSPVTYEIDGKQGMGFIAQEVRELCRKMELDWPVFDDTGEYMSIGYLNYVGILAAAIKELRHGI